MFIDRNGSHYNSSLFCHDLLVSSHVPRLYPMITAAHHFIWRHLYASMQAAQTPANKFRFVAPDKESRSMNTLWQEEEFEQICSRESLTEKATEIEKTISVKEHERECYDSCQVLTRQCFMKIVFGIGGQMP